MTTPPITALDREAAALLPCPTPWCSGADKPYIWQGPDDLFCVICAVCQVEGPSRDTEAEAEDAWNTRTAAERATSPAGDAGEVERLREALAWYGEQARLCRLIHSEGDAGRNALSSDGGKRARDALALLSQAGDADVVGEPGA